MVTVSNDMSDINANFFNACRVDNICMFILALSPYHWQW